MGTKQWYQQNKTRVQEENRQNYLRNPGLFKAKNLRKYGVTVVWYLAQYAHQGGLCAICRKGSGALALNVDHHHETGRVRALLCHKCNRALGLAGESPQVLRAAADYLETY